MGVSHRFNVAVTRAKGVLWNIGGDMMHRFWWKSGQRPLNLATRYKMELDAANQTHRFIVHNLPKHEGHLKNVDDKNGD